MDYTFQTDIAVTELLKFKISYCKTYNSYLFKNKWTNEVTDSFFKEQTENIKGLLHIQLRNGQNQTEYLQNLIDQIWKRIEWLKKYKSHSPDFFEYYSNKISKTTYYQEVPTLNTSKHEKFLNDSKDFNDPDYELFNFLKFHSNEMNDFKSLIDFEKGILLYTIVLYNEALNNLYHYIYSIHMDAHFIDFKNFSFEDLPKSNSKKRNNKLQHINFDKKSAAHLFRILLEEGVIVFDEFNEYKNRLEMKRFVEENFTYQNDKKERIPIKNFNREYSEACSLESSETKKQKEFLNKIITKLQTRKNNIKD